MFILPVRKDKKSRGFILLIKCHPSMIVRLYNLQGEASSAADWTGPGPRWAIALWNYFTQDKSSNLRCIITRIIHCSVFRNRGISYLSDPKSSADSFPIFILKHVFRIQQCQLFSSSNIIYFYHLWNSWTYDLCIGNVHAVCLS